MVRPSSTTDRSASRRSPSSPRRKSRVSPATSRPSGSKATECADSKPRHLDRLVGPAVRVAVGEGHDPVGASFGDNQHSIRRDVHEPGECEAFGEDRGLVFVGDDEPRETS